MGEKENPIKGSKNEVDLFDILVCQADKRVVCDPRTYATRTCRTKSESKAIARCDFSNALWLQGPTCIAGHVHGLPVKPCDITLHKNTGELIKKTNCRKALEA